MGRLIGTQLLGSGQPRELVVVVHGLKRRILEYIPKVVQKELPDADILIPHFDTSYRSNTNAADLAEELSESIETQCEEHQEATGNEYEQIILIGYSRGCLLLRKAYVFARGQAHDLELGGLQLNLRPWADRVFRIVLMAGMNRGWSLQPKPPKMSWIKNLRLRALDSLTRVTGTARLM